MSRFAVQIRLMLWRNSLLKVRRMKETLKGWLLPIGVFLYVARHYNMHLYSIH